MKIKIETASNLDARDHRALRFEPASLPPQASRVRTWSFQGLFIGLLAMLLTIQGPAADFLLPGEGPVPTVQANAAEPKAPPQFRPAMDDGFLVPHHPPIDQIPPMPMPDLAAPVLGNAEAARSKVLVHDSRNGQSFELGGAAAPALGGVEGEEMPGYGGIDGGGGTEVTPAGFGSMFEIGDATRAIHPWRMNAKLVMRFVDSGGNDQYYVCSGCMVDAETVLTAAHCVYFRGGGINNWAAEIWVYPGWDGAGGAVGLVNPYGWAQGTFYMAGANYVNFGDFNSDVGSIRLNRAVGMLTGWFGTAWGFSCGTIQSRTYNNASYPAEFCGGGLHTGSDMYYWSGGIDSCPGNQMTLATSPGCLTALWGGMSGSGMYYIDGGNRYVHAVASTSDRAFVGNYCKVWDTYFNDLYNSFIPGTRGATFDLQALDCNFEPAVINAGSTFSVQNHLATNPTDGSASGTFGYGVYLSSNDNISEFDTLLSSQFYSWTFNPMSSVTINMVPVTIPANTPPGNYWVGVQYDAGTDIDASNNDTDVWDAVPITVVCPAQGAPTGVSATDGTWCDRVRVTWTAPSGATEYYVYRNGSPLSGWIGSTLFDDFGATQGATYSYTVYARNACGNTSGVSASDSGSKCPVRTLTVTSSNPISGVPITVSPTDKNGAANGSTTFTRQYDNGTVVTLTAPATHLGRVFQKWQRDGVNYSFNAATTVTMDANRTMRAVYIYPDRTLSVASSNPNSGVNVTVAPNDKNGAGNGTTLFSRLYTHNTAVNLTAPASVAGRNFQKWQRNGVDFSTTAATSVTMDADYTMTAIYVYPDRTLTVASSNPASGVNVTVAPNDKNGAGNGTTVFNRLYNHGASVNLTAPASVGGGVFQKWQRDGVDYSATAATSVTMDANYTMTAIYAVADTAFVTGTTLAPTRNDITGFVGMRFQVAGSPVTVTALGRIFAAGNTGTHLLKLVNGSTGVDVPGGSVSINMTGGTAGQFKYGTLAAPVVLAAGATYYLASEETTGGDIWHTWSTAVTTTPVASVLSGIKNVSGGGWVAQGAAGQCFVPVNFKYSGGGGGPVVRTLTVNSANPASGVAITVSPVDNGALGNGTTSFTRNYNDGTVVNLTAPASAGGAAFQKWQRNGVDFSATAATSVTMDANYTMTAVYASSGTSFVTGTTLSTLRSDITGFLGMRFQVGASPVTVTSLGRIFAPGNTATHVVKLVNAATGVDVPGGSVSINMAGGTAGQFKYGTLAAPVVLSAGAAYYLASEETSGGDQWHTWNTTVVTTAVASVTSGIKNVGGGGWVVQGAAGQTFVPVNFRYSSPALAPASGWGEPWAIFAPQDDGEATGGE